MNKEFYILLSILLFIGFGTAVVISRHDDNSRKNPFDDIQHTVCLDLRHKAVRFFLNRDIIEAENHLRRLLKINSDDREMMLLYGRILLETGRVQEAEKLFRKMVSGNPLDWGAKNNLGAVLLLRNKYEAALREFQLASRNDTAVQYAGENLKTVSKALELLRQNKKFILVINTSAQNLQKHIGVITLSVLEAKTEI